jgi:hypothetical protein
MPDWNQQQINNHPPLPCMLGVAEDGPLGFLPINKVSLYIYKTNKKVQVNMVSVFLRYGKYNIY